MGAMKKAMWDVQPKVPMGAYEPWSESVKHRALWYLWWSCFSGSVVRCVGCDRCRPSGLHPDYVALFNRVGVVCLSSVLWSDLSMGICCVYLCWFCYDCTHLVVPCSVFVVPLRALPPSVVGFWWASGVTVFVFEFHGFLKRCLFSTTKRILFLYCLWRLFHIVFCLLSIALHVFCPSSGKIYWVELGINAVVGWPIGLWCLFHWVYQLRSGGLGFFHYLGWASLCFFAMVLFGNCSLLGWDESKVVVGVLFCRLAHESCGFAFRFSALLVCLSCFVWCFFAWWGFGRLCHVPCACRACPVPPSQVGFALGLPLWFRLFRLGDPLGPFFPASSRAALRFSSAVLPLAYSPGTLRSAARCLLRWVALCFLRFSAGKRVLSYLFFFLLLSLRPASLFAAAACLPFWLASTASLRCLPFCASRWLSLPPSLCPFCTGTGAFSSPVVSFFRLLFVSLFLLSGVPSLFALVSSPSFVVRVWPLLLCCILSRDPWSGAPVLFTWLSVLIVVFLSRFLALVLLCPFLIGLWTPSSRWPLAFFRSFVSASWSSPHRCVLRRLLLFAVEFVLFSPFYIGRQFSARVAFSSSSCCDAAGCPTKNKLACWKSITERCILL